jgi:hypothetical protein
MALVARFGFENNSALPENVSLIDNNISVNIPCNKFTTGRNDGTALVGYGYAMYDIANQCHILLQIARHWLGSLYRFID